MSYLEMEATPLPNMSKGIISLWIRDPMAQAAPPPPVLTTEPPGEFDPFESKTIGWPIDVPPNTQKIVQTDWPPTVYFWNAYGAPPGGVYSPFLGPPNVWMAAPPPIVTDNIRMVLTFGDPGQAYEYAPWMRDDPNVLKAVQISTLLNNPAGVPVWTPERFPPPYPPYDHRIGLDGKFVVANYKLGSIKTTSKELAPPQSFIGIDEGGAIVICLQTNTKADYKGYGFQLDRFEELWGNTTTWDVYAGAFHQHGPYWNGYQFYYKDISNDIMSPHGETFVLGGRPKYTLEFSPPPLVDGKGWHHVLFSFDISGAVHSEQTADDTGTHVQTSSSCKAWLAVDDVNYTADALQSRIEWPNGLLAPKLAGTETTDPLDILRPIWTYSHSQLGLGPNTIVPRNVYITSLFGLPKTGLLRFASNVSISTGALKGPGYVPPGDFNAIEWAAAEWPLFWRRGGYMPEFTPPRPTSPDPETFDSPTYDGRRFQIPAFGHPIGIPSSTHHLKFNTGVEMAELQIWAGKILDTGVLSNRRLFVDAEGMPVDMSTAEAVLGPPDVRLTGSSDWQEGFNSGSIGFDSGGEVLPAGQFRPRAQIDDFEPDPQLGK